MSVGERLRAERLRVGLSQPALAEVAGVTKGAVVKWEKDTASPNAAALIAFASRGLDAVYILTGDRTVDALTDNVEHWTDILDSIEDDLVGISKESLNEEIKSSILKRHRKTLLQLQQQVRAKKLPEMLGARADFVLQSMTDPAGLEQLQIKTFINRQIKENEAREGLKLWLDSCPYQPNEDVLSQMVSISIRYKVAYEPLVKLVQAVGRDWHMNYKG